ncbi:TPA: hypothetical protein ACH3X1_004698 [Trebouxia sp. C0004]
MVSIDPASLKTDEAIDRLKALLTKEFSQPGGLQIDILDRPEGLKGKKVSVKREHDGAGKQPEAKKEKTEWDVIHVAARDNMHSELRQFLPNKEDYAKQEWQQLQWIDENPKCDGNGIGNNGEAVPDSDDDDKASKGEDNASGDPSDA